MSSNELQARLRALDEAQIAYDEDEVDHKTVLAARQAVIEEARRVADGAGEPVAWVVQREPYLDGTPNPMHSLRWNLDKYPNNEDDLPPGTVLYTTPPSADALVEALGKLSSEWRTSIRSRDEYHEGFVYGRDLCADALDAALAKHKENTDGR